MSSAMEVLSGQVTAPGSTLSDLTASTGNSWTIRNAGLDSKIYLIDAWTYCQAAGYLRIRSPRMHDNVQGLRLGHGTGVANKLFPRGTKQVLLPQDTLDVELSGSSTAGDLEGASLLVFYEDLPGISARLATWADIADRVRHILAFDVSLSFGTGGDYDGEVAINSSYDVLKANEDYALLGYFCSAECQTVRFRGVDTGNLGVGAPGNANSSAYTNEYFKELSEDTGLPVIPVFNSANKNAILIDGIQNENGTDVTVTLIMAELAPGA